MVALLASGSGCGGRQEADAATPVAEWALGVEPAKVLLEEGGLRLEEQRWTWGPVSGLAWRASTPLPGHASIASQGAVVDFQGLLPADSGPWAAINGGFYDTEGRAMGLVVSGGQERSSFARGGGSGVFLMGPTGPRVVHRDAWQPGPTEALQSIDRVVDAGQSLVKRREGPLAARSAVVVGKDRLWLVALAEEDSVDRGPGGVRLDDTSGQGVSLGVWAEYLIRETAAVEALNLDGAVSTQLAVQAAGERFIVEGERGTINAVVLRP